MSFAEVSAIAETQPGHFSASIDPEWTIAGKPNGGYLLAILGRAACAVVKHGDALAASAHYLSSPDPGPVTIETEVLRGGRSASQVRVRLRQDGKACVEALFTVGTLDPDAKPFWDGGVPDREPIERADGLRIQSPTPTGAEVKIMGQMDLRLDPSCLGFGVGAPSGRGELYGWLELLEGEAFDPFSLLFAVDALPPATFEIEPTGWVPTLELTVYIRALPAPGPVRVLQKALLIDAGRVDEVCYVWDSTGRLVAQSTQLAAIRLG